MLAAWNHRSVESMVSAEAGEARRVVDLGRPTRPRQAGPQIHGATWVAGATR